MKILVSSLLLIVLFTTCKKYPDGGYTRKGPKNILGNWTLKLYEVNGIDSTNLINFNGDEGYKKVSINKNLSSFSLTYKGFSGISSVLTDGNKYLEVYGENITKKCSTYNTITYCYKAFLTPEVNSGSVATNWKVLEITKKEMKLSCTIQNQYKIILTK